MTWLDLRKVVNPPTACPVPRSGPLGSAPWTARATRLCKSQVAVEAAPSARSNNFSNGPMNDAAPLNLFWSFIYIYLEKISNARPRKDPVRRAHQVWLLPLLLQECIQIKTGKKTLQWFPLWSDCGVSSLLLSSPHWSVRSGSEMLFHTRRKIAHRSPSGAAAQDVREEEEKKRQMGISFHSFPLLSIVYLLICVIFIYDHHHRRLLPPPEGAAWLDDTRRMHVSSRGVDMGRGVQKPGSRCAKRVKKYERDCGSCACAVCITQVCTRCMHNGRWWGGGGGGGEHPLIVHIMIS